MKHTKKPRDGCNKCVEMRKLRPLYEKPRINQRSTCLMWRLEGLSNPIGTPEREGCFHATPTCGQGVGWGVVVSSDLKLLLKRTQKPQPKYREPSSEPSPALLALLGRMEARAWKEETLAATVEYIKKSANEIDFIKHLRTCKECQMEAEISVERYGGRGLPWFFDLINDPFECGANVEEYPYLKDCPRVQDYQIGSYWDKSTNHNETWKFISDRLNWAEKIVRQQIVSAIRFYKQLAAWDLNGSPPSEEVLPF